MKITYTNLLARKILLAFLLFTVVIAIAAFFVRNNITDKLAGISKLANKVDSDQPRPEQILLLLHQAEDDFQSSLLSADTNKSNDYKIKLQLAFNQIDTLIHRTTDTADLTAAQRNKIKSAFQEKLKLSVKLYELKHGFDSLLNVYAGFNKQSAQAASNLLNGTHRQQKTTNSSSDTVQKNNPAERKGLLKRIKEAIVNKNYGSAPSTKQINHNTTTHVNDINTQKIIARNNNAYTKEIQLLQQRNQKLFIMQRELIALNTRITGQLELIINDIKQLDYALAINLN